MQNTFTRIIKDIPVTSMKASKYMNHLPKTHGQPITDFNKESHWFLMQDWFRNYTRIDRFIIFGHNMLKQFGENG